MKRLETPFLSNLRRFIASMPEEKLAPKLWAEKSEDAQLETSSQPPAADKDGSISVLDADTNTKALTRKLLFKLDTRCVLSTLGSQV